MATIKDIKEQIEVKECRWCGAKLDLDDIKMYPHDAGWTLDGLKNKVWLYITCFKCGYDWAVWKLGVPRE